jgi:hypothetical protein
MRQLKHCENVRACVHVKALEVLIVVTHPFPEILLDPCHPFREKTPTALFFKYNSQLGPPYQVLVDTNFINFSIKNKVSTSICAFCIK